MFTQWDDGGWTFRLGLFGDVWSAVAMQESTIVNIGNYPTQGACKAACADFLVALDDPTSTVAKLMAQAGR